tara:strand:- start:194 stop:688 length:495 start_codon:yes stop_codon:yes gene_type:complete
MKITGTTSSDYLKTDSSGNVVAGTGTVSLTRVSYSVTGSDTSFATDGSDDGKAIYHNGTVWTLARANDEGTLCVAVIDDITGSSGDQTFNVVFCGGVPGYDGDQIDGASALVPGDWYWLSSANAGKITNTRPTGSGALVDTVGMAVTTTQLFVVPTRPNKLAVT